jgi:hypothetical protein
MSDSTMSEKYGKHTFYKYNTGNKIWNIWNA